MKYDFIHTYRSVFAVEKMCQVLEISRSGYYRWNTGCESKRSLENKAILEAIKDIFAKPMAVPGLGKPWMIVG